MPNLSRRAISLAVLAGSVWLLLMALGCRSVEVPEAFDERDAFDLASEVLTPEPNEAALADAVTVTTILPGSVDDSEDEPSAPSDAVDSTAVPDGTRWEPPVLPLCRDLVFPEGLAVELAEVSTLWDFDPPSVEFDGWSVSAMHAPAPNWAYSALSAVIWAERANPRAFEDQFLFVTITSESGSERTHRLPLAPPWEVHPSLRIAADAGRIVVTDAGWMIPVSVITFMDSRLLVSEHFAEYAPGVNEAVPHDDGHRNISGLRISLTNRSGYDGSDYAGECLASWAELGTTEEMYDQYGLFVVFNKPYHAVDQESAYLWVSRWDGEPVQAELPNQWGRCCSLQVLDDGYLAFSSTAQAGAPVWPSNGPQLHYSRNGFEWREVDLPTTKFTFDDGYTDPDDAEWIDIPIWVCSVESTDSGVLIAQGQGHPPGGGMCGTVRYWIADSDLTNWRLHPDAQAADG